MRPSSKEKLHALVDAQIADIYQQAGHPIPGTEGDGEAIPDIFDGITIENVRTGLDMLSHFNALAVRMVAPRFMRHPFKKDPATGKPAPLIIDPDILTASFTLTPEQHAELDPRALKEVQRYSHKMPEWMKKHLNLVMLVTMYAKYTGENALRAMQTQVLRDASTARAAQAKQPRGRPIDTDRAAPDPHRVALSEDEPMNTATEYPPAQPSNGGVEAQL